MRKAQNSRRNTRKFADDVEVSEVKPHKQNLPRFEAKTSKQELLYKAALRCPLVGAIGPAGTGKSYTLVYAALDMYFSRKISQIVITRSPNPTGKTLGLFPGTAEEKLAHWLAPVLSQFVKALNLVGNGETHLGNLLHKVIKLVPMETLMGSSWDDSFIIVEETQQCDMDQLAMLSTRIGDGSTLALNGDFRQSRLKQQCDFADFVFRIREFDERVANKPEHTRTDWEEIPTPFIEFGADDIVRSGVTRKMVSIFY